MTKGYINSNAAVVQAQVTPERIAIVHHLLDARQTTTEAPAANDAMITTAAATTPIAIAATTPIAIAATTTIAIAATATIAIAATATIAADDELPHVEVTTAASPPILLRVEYDSITPALRGGERKSRAVGQGGWLKALPQGKARGLYQRSLDEIKVMTGVDDASTGTTATLIVSGLVQLRPELSLARRGPATQHDAVGPNFKVFRKNSVPPQTSSNRIKLFRVDKKRRTDKNEDTAATTTAATTTTVTTTAATTAAMTTTAVTTTATTTAVVPPNKKYRKAAPKTSKPSQLMFGGSGTPGMGHNWTSTEPAKRFMREMDSESKLCPPVAAPLRTDDGRSNRTKAAAARPANLKTDDDEPGYAYQETVRCKIERAGLPCKECYQCKRFYEVLEETGHDIAVGDVSRHHNRHGSNDTPTDFWELDFMDEIRVDRKKLDQQGLSEAQVDEQDRHEEALAKAKDQEQQQRDKDRAIKDQLRREEAMAASKLFCDKPENIAHIRRQVTAPLIWRRESAIIDATTNEGKDDDEMKDDEGKDDKGKDDEVKDDDEMKNDE
jgi:hypothetical protein